MPSLCTRFTRLVTCTRAHYSAKPTPPPTHPKAITCVFEPRIDVLEKLVAELTSAVQQHREELSTHSTQATTDTERILHLLDQLRAEHAALTTRVDGRCTRSCKDEGVDTAACTEQRVMAAEDRGGRNTLVEIERPSLVLPPPLLRRAEMEDSQVCTSQPIDINIDPSRPTAAGAVHSPSWYPVSVPPTESSAYEDAYSSEDDDYAMSMGGPRMLDA